MLLLSGIHRKDGQLVELDAVQKRWLGTNTNTLVGTSIHANPGVLGVHLVDNLVPMGLRIANNETTEHFECFLGVGDCNLFLDLEDHVELRKRLLQDFLRGFGLVFRELEIGLHFPSNFNNCIPGHFVIVVGIDR